MRTSKREITFISIGGILVLALVYYLTLLSPAFSKQKSLKRLIALKQSNLTEMKDLKKEWEAFQGRRLEVEKVLKRKGKRFALLSFLEETFRNAGIEKNIDYMKPLPMKEIQGNIKWEGIEVKIKGIGIKDLLFFLYKIEYSKRLLSISRIKIQRSQKSEDQTLTVTMQIKTYIPR